MKREGEQCGEQCIAKKCGEDLLAPFSPFPAQQLGEFLLEGFCFGTQTVKSFLSAQRCAAKPMLPISR